MFEPLTYISEPEHASVEEASFDQKPPEKPSSKIPSRPVFIIAAILVAAFSTLAFFTSAPQTYPTDSVFTVAQGETLSGVASSLYSQGVIRSPRLFKAYLLLAGGFRGLRAGDYYLERGQSSLVLAWRFSHSMYALRPVKMTIPEGWSVREIAKALSTEKKFVKFNEREFISLGEKQEGYLFPDTYLFLPNVSAQDMADAMRKNFDRRIAEISTSIFAFGRPLSDIVKMASIIEEEARTPETRRIVAGILWKRLDEGMPLQVDAAFAFVNGKKDSKYLTLNDLQIDSPYNTYVHKGLPPTPISNPGLDAILATVTPTRTKYYFYLSDDKGGMHYGVTLDEHLANKAKYLSW